MTAQVDGGGAWQIGGAEGGWWALERSKLIAARLGPTVRSAHLAIDLGCGRGEAVDLFVDLGASFTVGIDAEPSPGWRPRAGRCAFVCADLGRIPLRPGVADLVTAFDVIEHFADDATPLAGACAAARPGATVAVTVPAHPRLWSPFDERVGHHRRYTREVLERSLRRSRIDPRDVTSFFAWLAVPAYLLRSRDRAGADDATGLVGRTEAAIAALLCRLERAVLRRRPLSFGTSLWASGEVSGR